MKRVLCLLLLMVLAGVASAGNSAPGDLAGPHVRQDAPAPDAQKAPDGGLAMHARQPALARQSWGAVVVDQSTGSAYGRYDQLTELAAIKNTRLDCGSAGSSGCEVLATYKNACIAVVSGAPGADKTPLFWATASNPGDAAFAALEKCGDVDQCEVFYQRCTNPSPR